MSALVPKADICQRERHVCQVPIADIHCAATETASAATTGRMGSGPDWLGPVPAGGADDAGADFDGAYSQPYPPADSTAPHLWPLRWLLGRA